MPIIFHKYYLQDANELKIFNDNEQGKRLALIDILYEKYAPKIFGYILNFTNDKKEAHIYLSKVFIHATNNIYCIDELTEKRILFSVLIVCKPLYKATKILSNLHQYINQ